MQREKNVYRNSLTEETLNAASMKLFVEEEAKRQLEENSGEKWEEINNADRETCIMEQFKHQLEDRGWECWNNGVKI